MNIETRITVTFIALWMAAAVLSLGVIGLVVWMIVKHITS